MSLSDKLRHARERSALTGARVRELTGISEPCLSEFENGKREPKLSQLHRLAAAYNSSISFLLSEESIPAEVVLWRERPTDRAGEIESRFLRLCEQYHNLEVWCNEAVPPCLPQAEGVAEEFGYPQAKQLAKDVRDQLNLGDRPAFELLGVLEEKCGVKVFHQKFEPTGVAACARSNVFGAGVLLNSANVRWRRNHDLAHELFHLLTWEVFRGKEKVESLDAGKNEESLAGWFAGNLLMPEEAFSLAVERRMRDGRLEIKALYDIAREFDVSVESLLWRLNALYRRGRTGKEQTEKDIENARAWARVFEDREGDDREATERPQRYRALAVKALQKGEISLGRFAEYMGISRYQARSYLEREASAGEEAEIALA